ncbi:MAG: hypothetical protein QM503_05080 [Bacteroidota bacterium]
MITLGKINKNKKQLPLSIKLLVDNCIEIRQFLQTHLIHNEEQHDYFTISILKELELIDEFSIQMGIELKVNSIYAFTYGPNTAILIITNHQGIIEVIHKVNTNLEEQMP